MDAKGGTVNWSALTIFAIPKSMTSGMPYMNWNSTLQLGWNCGCYLECHFDLSVLKALSLSNFSKSLPSLFGGKTKGGVLYTMQNSHRPQWPGWYNYKSKQSPKAQTHISSKWECLHN